MTPPGVVMRYGRAVLYVCTNRHDVLTPIGVLFVREVVGLLDEYFGIHEATVARERRLKRDHRVGYRGILAAIDTGRVEPLAAIVNALQAVASRQTGGSDAIHVIYTLVVPDTRPGTGSGAA